MGDCLEAVAGGDAIFELGGKAILDFDHLRAIAADQVMVMPMIRSPYQLVPCDPVAELKPVYQSRLFEHSNGTVNRRQVAPFDGHP